ncbi:START domain-containing protein [Algoriphagus taiwanensis]|uniref:START domain-containing protein n=1 Tax=Algoriphagus taiwanensis TaxID=1445656 RepID=A0ABQ6PZW1_9BACT|nr:START domain-containing protein [Algoriphagus taiwanensis]
MRITLTIALLTFFTFPFGTQQKDCELRKSAEGIEVYTCKMEDSKINSIQSSFTVSTSIEALSEALFDLDNFHKWQYKIRKTEMLKRISSEEFVYRAELQTPWPVSNRDLILQVKMSKGSKPNEYHFSAIGRPGFIPPRDGFVRVPLSEAHWYIQVVDDHHIEIKHSILIDPGGSIPAWLMNLSLAEGPFETFKSLREYLADGN